MSVIKKVIDHKKPGEDIGLDHSARKGRQRTINVDGRIGFGWSGAEELKQGVENISRPLKEI